MDPGSHLKEDMKSTNRKLVTLELDGKRELGATSTNIHNCRLEHSISCPCPRLQQGVGLSVILKLHDVIVVMPAAWSGTLPVVPGLSSSHPLGRATNGRAWGLLHYST